MIPQLPITINQQPLKQPLMFTLRSAQCSQRTEPAVLAAALTSLAA